MIGLYIYMYWTKLKKGVKIWETSLHIFYLTINSWQWSTLNDTSMSFQQVNTMLKVFFSNQTNVNVKFSRKVSIHNPLESMLKFKGAWSFFFSKFSFLFHLKNQHSKSVNLKFHFKLDEQSNFVYYSCLLVSLIMVTITSHVFISIFQKEPFSVAKFYMSYEENMSFLVIPKIKISISQSWQIGLASFKHSKAIALLHISWLKVT